MSDVHFEAAPRNVIFIRSVFYGIGAGGLNGAIWGVVIGVSDCGLQCVLIGVPAFGIGALIGGAVGLILGIVVLLARPVYDPKPRGLQTLVAGLAMAVVFLALSILTQRPPINVIALIFLISAGLAAWFLLPLVVRPEGQNPMPTIGRQ